MPIEGTVVVAQSDPKNAASDWVNHLEEVHRLEKALALLDWQIATLAGERIERVWGSRLRELNASLAGFGFPQAAAEIRYETMWEDVNCKLPPRIQAELCIRVSAESTLRRTLHIDIGALHAPGKDEDLFERCMVRGEAREDLHRMKTHVAAAAPDAPLPKLWRPLAWHVERITTQDFGQFQVQDWKPRFAKAGPGIAPFCELLVYPRPGEIDAAAKWA